MKLSLLYEDSEHQSIPELQIILDAVANRLPEELAVKVQEGGVAAQIYVPNKKKILTLRTTLDQTDKGPLRHYRAESGTGVFKCSSGNPEDIIAYSVRYFSKDNYPIR